MLSAKVGGKVSQMAQKPAPRPDRSYRQAHASGAPAGRPPPRPAAPPEPPCPAAADARILARRGGIFIGAAAGVIRRYPVRGVDLPKRRYDRAHASLRISGESLDPLTVTLALRLPPDLTYRRGEPRLRRAKNGRVIEHSPHRVGMWLMSSEQWVDSPRLETHLRWLLDQLEPKAETVRALLSTGVTADFFCFAAGSSPRPPALPRAVRERAAALGIEIGIDYYGPPVAERPTG